ncbi:hypothetical protein [Nocardia callitridis]|uniref:Uncharacterized protein n=1 Tax=Nocardia callitridis TaxID=648753 RepID=A0ABP9KNH1_9NOCA
MSLPLPRLLLRAAIAATMTLGPLLVLSPTAAAAGCEEGAARVFFSNSTNTCLGPGTTSYNGSPAVSKVCSAPGVSVQAEATFKKSRTKTFTRALDLASGRCGRFDITGQLDATLTVS